MIPASLPPNSSVMRFSVLAADAITRAPVAVEPVNEILLMPLCVVILSPRSLLSAIILTTPAGKTSAISEARCRADNGVVGAGLTITVLPANSAAGNLKANKIIGKFQGIIAPTTPSGLRWISTRCVSLSSKTSTGRSSD